MNIGVVGGSGFIGSHIVDELLNQNHDVTVFDIMRPHRDDVRHITLDITDFRKVAIALTGYYDAIYHLAAVADVNDVYRNPVESMEVNIQATVNVLEAARRSNIKRVILASTIWVYEAGHMFSPEDSEDDFFGLVDVKHLYTSSKIASELMCISYQKLYNQNYTILRYGIPYGPRGRAGTVITNFVKAAMMKKPITIFGDGSQTRHYIHVKDLAYGNVLVLDPKAKNQIINLCNRRDTSVLEIVDIVRSRFPDLKIEKKDPRPGDYQGSLITNNRLKRLLDWEPQIGIETGINEYIDLALGMRIEDP